MNKHILVLAYPGTGKTYIAENYSDVSDLEFQHFRYDYGSYKNLPLEQLKGRTDIRTLKPEWPNNFFEFLERELEKTKCVLVPFATSLLPVLDYLSNEKNVRVIFAIQEKNMFESIVQTYKQRGNSDEFVERRRKDFFKAHNVIDLSKFEKIYLTNGEFLLDGLHRVGVKFNKGKGYKNYI